MQLRSELKAWNNMPLSGIGDSSRLQSKICLMHSGSCVFWLFLSSFLSRRDIGSVRNYDGSAQTVHLRAQRSGPEMGHVILVQAL